MSRFVYLRTVNITSMTKNLEEYSTGSVTLFEIIWTLLGWHKRERFLHCIVASDEKWIHYNNHLRLDNTGFDDLWFLSRHVLDDSKCQQHCSAQNFISHGYCQISLRVIFSCFQKCRVHFSSSKHVKARLTEWFRTKESIQPRTVKENSIWNGTRKISRLSLHTCCTKKMCKTPRLNLEKVNIQLLL